MIEFREIAKPPSNYIMLTFAGDTVKIDSQFDARETAKKLRAAATLFELQAGEVREGSTP